MWVRPDKWSYPKNADCFYVRAGTYTRWLKSGQVVACAELQSTNSKQVNACWLEYQASSLNKTRVQSIQEIHKRAIEGYVFPSEVHNNEYYVASPLVFQKIKIGNIRTQYSFPVACFAAEKPYLRTRNCVSFSQRDELVAMKTVPNGDSHVNIT